MLGLVIQAVLFEGWMLGFKPLPMEVVKAVDPQVGILEFACGYLELFSRFYSLSLDFHYQISLKFVVYFAARDGE